MIRKFVIGYCAVGLVWGTFCAYQGYRAGTYPKEDVLIYAPLNVVVNATIWPISVSVGIARLTGGR